MRETVNVLEPVLDVVDRCFIVRGTASHTGGSGHLEELIAQDVDTVVPYSKHVKSHWHLRQVFAGQRFDVCHHTTQSKRPWTRANSANYLASELIQGYAELGDKLPDFAIRSHVHKHVDTHDNFAVRVIVLPAWQLLTGYVHQVVPNAISHIGAVAVLIDGDQVVVKKWIDKPYRITKSLWKNFKI